MAQRDRAPLPALDRQTNTWLRGADPSSTAVQGLSFLWQNMHLSRRPCLVSLILFFIFLSSSLVIFRSHFSLSSTISKAATMHTGRDTGERQYRVFTLVFVSDWFPCVFTDDLLGKRRSFSPNSSSECPSESKKLRSVSPKGRQCICVLWCYRCVKLFEGKKDGMTKEKRWKLTRPLVNVRMLTPNHVSPNIHANIPAEKGVMGDYRSQRPREQMMCQISVCHMLLVEIGVCRSSHLVPLSSYICTH